MADEELRIGDLAKATATKVETIRYYERIGLLPAPGRTAGNYRAYGPRHWERLGSVRARANSDGCGLEGVVTRGHAALRRLSTVTVRRRRSSRRRSAETGWLWRERRRRKLRSSS